MKIAMKGRAAFLVKDDTLIERSKNAYTVEFAFDDSWVGFEKIAVFKAGIVSEETPLTDDVCVIPSKCLETGGIALKIGIYGKKDGETTERIWCFTSRILSSAKIDVPFAASGGWSDETYREIQKTLKELADAGYEGMTLTEVLAEVRNAADLTATDKEVDDVLDDVFDRANSPENPIDDSDGQTATDDEVDDLLNDVFGHQAVNK